MHGLVAVRGEEAYSRSHGTAPNTIFQSKQPSGHLTRNLKMDSIFQQGDVSRLYNVDW